MASSAVTSLSGSLAVLSRAKILVSDLVVYLQARVGTSPKNQVKTRVVRIRRQGGRIVQDCDVYVGRAQNQGGWRLCSHPLANPFNVKKYGREACLQLYRDWLLASPGRVKLAQSLRGKILGCWCHPEACHADIIAEVADASSP